MGSQRVRFHCLFVVFLGSLAGMAAAAQDVILHYPHTGESIPLNAKSLPPEYRQHPSATVLKQTNITFTITYQDVVNDNNIGFDDPNLGAARRATVDAVLAYIDGILNENGSCDIVFAPSVLAGGETLATMGTFYFTGEPGYQTGFSTTHITTGVDPLEGTPDITGQVDFGNPLFIGEGTPPNGQFDFFSLILHECTHGLGFTSLTAANGSSRLSPNAYSELDRLMTTGNGKDLFPDVSGSPSFLGIASDLTGGDNGVFFLGSEAINALNVTKGGLAPQMNTPGMFLTGTSLSHWDSVAHFGSVMVPALVSGTAVREYSNVELGALSDLGYVNVVPPMSGGGMDIPGDVDGDMSLGSADIQFVINGALNLNIGMVDADIDCSNAVDSVDVQLAINAVLNLPIGPFPMCP